MLDTEDQYGSLTGGLITERLYWLPFIRLPYYVVRLLPVIGQHVLPLCSQHLEQRPTKKHSFINVYRKRRPEIRTNSIQIHIH